MGKEERDKRADDDLITKRLGPNPSSRVKSEPFVGLKVSVPLLSMLIVFRTAFLISFLSLEPWRNLLYEFSAAMSLHE